MTLTYSEETQAADTSINGPQIDADFAPPDIRRPGLFVLFNSLPHTLFRIILYQSSVVVRERRATPDGPFKQVNS